MITDNSVRISEHQFATRLIGAIVMLSARSSWDSNDRQRLIQRFTALPFNSSTTPSQRGPADKYQLPINHGFLSLFMRKMKYKLTTFILLILLPIVNDSFAENLSKNELTANSSQAREIQRKIFSGEVESVFENHLDKELTAKLSKKKFTEFINQLTTKSGPIKNTILFNYKEFTPDIIRVSFITEFDRGVSVESYFLRPDKQSKIKLVRYEITDPSKFSF